MKTIPCLLTLLLFAGAARAASVSSPSVSTQSITLPGDSYTLDFGVSWSCDDFPLNSAPGRIELVDGDGTVIGRVVASVYQPGGISISVSGAGTVTNASAAVGIYAPNGTPADGGLTGTWNITGVTPGSYTLRFYDYTTWETTLWATTVWTSTYSNGGSAPPAAVQYSLVTSAGAGGTVSPGGTYDAGEVVTITATADATHDFAGWSGDVGGTGNPVGLVMVGNKAVQANFSPRLFALVTSASAGGNVSPGGSYPYGTTVTVSAAPDATHRFIGWSGDASGTAPSILVTLTSPQNVQAVFADKTAQTVTFPTPGNLPVGGPASALGGSASSGLPVIYTILNGPATLNGNQVQITGPGTVTVQADQPGDQDYLPAPAVTQTFNAVGAALLKYRSAGRTLLQDSVALNSAPFVLEKP